MNMIRICSITISLKKQGLYIYSHQLEKLMTRRFPSISYAHYYFGKTKTEFVPKRLPTNVHKSVYEDFKNRIDVIHMHFDTESLFFDCSPTRSICKLVRLLLYVRKFRLPTVVTIHGLFDDTRKYGHLGKFGTILFVHMLAYRRKVVFISHSNMYKEELCSLFPAYEKSIVYIPHLIYPELIDNRTKRTPDKKIHLTTLGFIDEWKGQEKIIRIVIKASKQLRNITYIIAGLAFNKAYYRNCMSLIKTDGKHNIAIVNKFLTPKEFNHYLNDTDIYLDYHARGGYASSGTVAHALVRKKVILARNFSVNPGNQTNIHIARTDDDYYRKLIELVRNFTVHTDSGVADYKKINNKIASEHMQIYRSVIQ